MTLATIRSTAKTKLRITSTSTDNLLSDSVLTGLVNEAVRKVSRERAWPWLLTSATVSVATTGLGTLPTDFLQARELLYGTDPSPVPYVSFDAILASKNAYVWSENGTSIVVEPAPASSTNFTLWYYQREEALSADGDLPLIPATYEDIVATWTAHLGALVRRDYDHAAALERQYRDELESLSRVVFRKTGGGVKVGLRRERTTIPARW